jgi:hypothetical protein
MWAGGRHLIPGWPTLCCSVFLCSVFFAKGGPLFSFTTRNVVDQSIRRFKRPPFNPQQSPFNPHFRLFPAKYFTSSPIPCYSSRCSARNPSFRRIVPLFSAPSVSLRLASFLRGVIPNAVRDLLFVFLLSAPSASTDLIPVLLCLSTFQPSNLPTRNRLPFPAIPFRTPLKSAFPQNAPVTPVECAVSKQRT